MQQSQRERYKDIVDRFVQLAQANLDKPTRIPDLSRAIGVKHVNSDGRAKPYSA